MNRLWSRLFCAKNKVLLSGGMALSLVLSGCGGTEQGPRRPAGTASPTPTGTPEADAGAPLILTPVAPPAPPPPGPVEARPRAPRAPRAPAQAPAPPQAPAGPVALSPAAPGTYLFAETGITRIRGCLTLDQPPPASTKLVVGQANGNRQHFDRDQRDPVGAGSLTSADVEYRADGIYLTYLRQTQTSLLSSQPTEFQPDPAVLLLPAGATAGRAWSFSVTSRDGGVKIDTQNRVEAVGEPVSLGNGQTVETTKIVADSRITGQSSQGSLDLTRRMTSWYAPASGLAVREVTDVQGRIGLCQVDSHIEATLRSL